MVLFFVLIGLIVISYVWLVIDYLFLTKRIKSYPEIEELVNNFGKEQSNNDGEKLKWTLLNSKIENEGTKQKKRYFSYYAISGIVFGVLDILCIIVFVFLPVDFTSRVLGVLYALLNMMFLWGIKISPFLHYHNIHHFTKKVDTFVFGIIYAQGKMYENIKFIANEMIAYVAGMVFFAIYVWICAAIPETIFARGFSYLLGAILLYHFVVNGLIAWLVSWRTKKDFAYWYEECRNTSYIIFLTFYMFGLIERISMSDNNGFVYIEAFGVLYLIDTYFDKLKATREKYVGIHSNLVNETKEKIKIEEEKMTENKGDIEVTEEFIGDIEVNETVMYEYYEIVTREYQNEITKKQSFDTRAGYLITILSALFVFFFQTISIRDIIVLFEQALTFIVFLKIICGIGFYFLFVITFTSIVNILTAKRQDVFNVEEINYSYLVENRNNGLEKIIKTYREIIIQQRQLNRDRAKWLKKALYCTFGLVLTIIMYISL